jgi:hypothetical protein
VREGVLDHQAGQPRPARRRQRLVRRDEAGELRAAFVVVGGRVIQTPLSIFCMENHY